MLNVGRRIGNRPIAGVNRPIAGVPLTHRTDLRMNFLPLFLFAVVSNVYPLFSVGSGEGRRGGGGVTVFHSLRQRKAPILGLENLCPRFWPLTQPRLKKPSLDGVSTGIPREAVNF